VTVPEGSVPYPAGADAPTLQAGAIELTCVLEEVTAAAQALETIVVQTTGGPGSTNGGWTGAAATAWAGHVRARAARLTALAASLSGVPAALETMAAVIERTSAAYSSDVTQEAAARDGLPQTAVALLRAVADEGEEVAALEVAGVACAAHLMTARASLATDVLAGLGTEIGTDVGEAAWAAVDGMVADLNAVIQLPLGWGTLRVNLLGSGLAATGWGWPALQADVGGALRALETPLHAEEDDRLLDLLRANGYEVNPADITAVDHDEKVLEATRRAPGDESLVMVHTMATGDAGEKILTMTLGGINPSGSALPGGTGSRSVGDATASQITGWGREEQALYDWAMDQGLQPGDTVNLFAHSQGGIVAQNVANQLEAQGIHVNLATDGSPETQLGPDTTAWRFQNSSDVVPATRVAGVAGLGTMQFAGQQVTTFSTPDDPLTAHDPDTYGSWAAAHPDNAGAASFNAWAAGPSGPAAGSNQTTGVTVFSGSQPVTVPQPPTTTSGSP
jgi:hypothetical protein